jgi:hypothetical protein
MVAAPAAYVFAPRNASPVVVPSTIIIMLVVPNNVLHVLHDPAAPDLLIPQDAFPVVFGGSPNDAVVLVVPYDAVVNADLVSAVPVDLQNVVLWSAIPHPLVVFIVPNNAVAVPAVPNDPSIFVPLDAVPNAAVSAVHNNCVVLGQGTGPIVPSAVFAVSAVLDALHVVPRDVVSVGPLNAVPVIPDHHFLHVFRASLLVAAAVTGAHFLTDPFVVAIVHGRNGVLVLVLVDRRDRILQIDTMLTFLAMLVLLVLFTMHIVCPAVAILVILAVLVVLSLLIAAYLVSLIYFDLIFA